MNHCHVNVPSESCDTLQFTVVYIYQSITINLALIMGYTRLKLAYTSTVKREENYSSTDETPHSVSADKNTSLDLAFCCNATNQTAVCSLQPEVTQCGSGIRGLGYSDIQWYLCQ